MIIVALRIDRNRAERALLQDSQRILIGPIIDAQHDNRTHARPQHARIGSAFPIGSEPVHVTMRAGIEERAEMFCRIGDRIRSGNANAIEPKRARFAHERRLQIGGRELEACVQKSRST